MEYIHAGEEPCAIMQEEQHWDERGERERNKVICKVRKTQHQNPL
jgi:hypothetical protein